MHSPGPGEKGKLLETARSLLFSCNLSEPGGVTSDSQEWQTNNALPKHKTPGKWRSNSTRYPHLPRTWVWFGTMVSLENAVMLACPENCALMTVRGRERQQQKVGPASCCFQSANRNLQPPGRWKFSSVAQSYPPNLFWLDRAGPAQSLSQVRSSLQARITLPAAYSVVNTNDPS